MEILIDSSVVSFRCVCRLAGKEKARLLLTLHSAVKTRPPNHVVPEPLGSISPDADWCSSTGGFKLNTKLAG